MDLLSLSPLHVGIIIILAVWTLIWKGFALWAAARNGQRNWFIAMLLINTCGILEIVYLFYFAVPKDAPPTIGIGNEKKPQ